jgi:hypothetical protein
MDDKEDRTLVIERLEAYERDIDALMELLQDKRHFSRDEQEIVREKYRALKENLRGDHKAGSTLRGDAELTQCERQYFQPSVTGAFCQLRAATNSNPVRWYSELYAARIDIQFYLRQLQRHSQAEV